VKDYRQKGISLEKMDELPYDKIKKRSSPKELVMIEGFKGARVQGFKGKSLFSQLIGRRTREI